MQHPGDAIDEVQRCDRHDGFPPKRGNRQILQLLQQLVAAPRPDLDEALLLHVDADRHRALRAEIGWQLTVCANAAGDWGSAARYGTEAAQRFRFLGEEVSALRMDAFAAMAIEMIGDSDLAWQLRHLPRSVLRDEGGTATAGEQTTPSQENRSNRWTFLDQQFTGQVNLLTTASTTPLSAPHATATPRGVAFIVVGAPVGVTGDWYCCALYDTPKVAA